MTHHTPFSIAGLCCFWHSSLTLYWQSEWLERMSTQLRWRGFLMKAWTSPPPDSVCLRRRERRRNIRAPHAYVFSVILDQFKGHLQEFWLLCKDGWTKLSEFKVSSFYFHFHVVVNIFERRASRIFLLRGACGGPASINAPCEITPKMKISTRCVCTCHPACDKVIFCDVF